MGSLNPDNIGPTGFGGIDNNNVGGLAGPGTVRSTTWSTNPDHISIVANPDYTAECAGILPETFIRHRWEPTPAGGNGTEITEVRFQDCGGAAGRTVCLRDWVKLEDPWDWGTSANPFEWGGKMGGLMGGSSPVGGQNNTDGFSVRWDWSENGEAQLYVYHQDRAQNCSGGTPQTGASPCFGDEFKSTFVYPIGEWFCRELCVTMNTGPDEFDGSVTASINGQQIISQGGLRFQTSGPTPYQVDEYAYVNLFGGGSAWAPPQTQFSCHANIEWSTSAIGCGVAPDDVTACGDCVIGPLPAQCANGPWSIDLTMYGATAPVTLDQTQYWDGELSAAGVWTGSDTQNAGGTKIITAFTNGDGTICQAFFDVIDCNTDCCLLPGAFGLLAGLACGTTVIDADDLVECGDLTGIQFGTMGAVSTILNAGQVTVTIDGPGRLTVANPCGGANISIDFTDTCDPDPQEAVCGPATYVDQCENSSWNLPLLAGQNYQYMSGDGEIVFNEWTGSDTSAGGNPGSKTVIYEACPLGVPFGSAGCVTCTATFNVVDCSSDCLLKGC